jgi:hypothetical protein
MRSTVTNNLLDGKELLSNLILLVPQEGFEP